MRKARSAAALCAMIMLVIPARRAFAAGQVGQPAPALVVQELSGQAFDLSAERGKVVLINFWATWCAPCRAEMPALDGFYQQYHSGGLEMIGLSDDSPHDKPDVRKVMQSFNYPGAMLNDADPNGFGDPDQIPETFVVDRSGVVRAVFTPDQTPVTAQSLANAVLPLLGEGAAAPAAPSATH